MASSAASAASTRAAPLQTAAAGALAAVERWLEAERDQIALWLPVALGAGIAAWFVLPDPVQWRAALLALASAGLLALAVGRGGRLGRVLAVGALAAALGLALVWWRAERVAAPVLARATVAQLTGRVARIEPQPARGLVRVRLDSVSRVGEGTALPPAVRVNLAEADVPAGLAAGTRLRLRARLMPPAPPAVPGAYDFARVAWFQGLGATGRGFAPVTVEASAAEAGDPARARLTRHIHRQVDGSAGGVAAALVTGDTGAIAETDAEAMRRAGLSHLLSVSGLHITAVVVLTMWLAGRLLALSVPLALTGRVPLIAAGFAAAAAVTYTWLAGGEVPTIRSCVAALLVLAALAIGREAVTLRLVAAGALIVLLVWPEALAGPSFQLSFAAVTAIVAMHEHPRVRGWFGPREGGWSGRAARGLASLLLTGLLVEAALMPIAVYHFHKAGLYGALANIAAIPLTTFLIMPAEALALLLDLLGLGAPAWWVAERGLALLLWLARTVAEAPGAVAALPAMPAGAFALCVAGGLWIALWRTAWRRLGVLPLAAGIGWALATPPPDLLVTGDGRHLAVRGADGGVAMLRDRAGDYVQDMLAENGGSDAAPALLSGQDNARCGRDLCLAEVARGGRRWRVLATRSADHVPIAAMVAQCRAADVVVSERRLPRTCRPRWLKLDRPALARTGGVAVSFAAGRVTTVRRVGDRHPWVAAAERPNRVRQAGPDR